MNQNRLLILNVNEEAAGGRGIRDYRPPSPAGLSAGKAGSEAGLGSVSFLGSGFAFDLDDLFAEVPTRWAPARRDA